MYHMWAYGTKLCNVIVCLYIFVWNLSRCTSRILETPHGSHPTPKLPKELHHIWGQLTCRLEILIQYGDHGRQQPSRVWYWTGPQNWMCFLCFFSRICVVCDRITNILCIYVWSKSGFYALLNILVTESKTYSGTTIQMGPEWSFCFSLKDCYPTIPKLSHQFRLGEIMIFHHQPGFAMFSPYTKADFPITKAYSP